MVLWYCRILALFLFISIKIRPNSLLNSADSSKIPSRDAFPSDISNIHASISERCGKLKLCYFNGSITAFPIIETSYLLKLVFLIIQLRV